MTTADFELALSKEFGKFFELVATDDGAWTVKGFIDIYKNIYTISLDTKVVSKIVELMIFPVILKFAQENGYEMILSSHQNHYPDITFIDKASGVKIAVDLKSTYRVTDARVNGMTLGAFTGYFRNRQSSKNITFPYNQYDKHYVLGVIYSRTDMIKASKILEEIGIKVTPEIKKITAVFLSKGSDDALDALMQIIKDSGQEYDELSVVNGLMDCLGDEKKKFTLADLAQITSVVRDFDFFLQEKWKIAIDRPGSGNTKNIGSTTVISELRDGTGLFTMLKNGEAIFNDFWTFYLTADMARAIDLAKPPYNNVRTYLEYKKL